MSSERNKWSGRVRVGGSKIPSHKISVMITSEDDIYSRGLVNGFLREVGQQSFDASSKNYSSKSLQIGKQKFDVGLISFLYGFRAAHSPQYKETENHIVVVNAVDKGNGDVVNKIQTLTNKIILCREGCDQTKIAVLVVTNENRCKVKELVNDIEGVNSYFEKSSDQLNDKRNSIAAEIVEQSFTGEIFVDKNLGSNTKRAR